MPPQGESSKAAWRSRSLAIFVIARAGAVRRPIAPMKLVQATKEPDQYQNRNRYPKKPQQQIASHRQSSTFLVRELCA